MSDHPSWGDEFMWPHAGWRRLATAEHRANALRRELAAALNALEDVTLLLEQLHDAADATTAGIYSALLFDPEWEVRRHNAIITALAVLTYHGGGHG